VHIVVSQLCISREHCRPCMVTAKLFALYLVVYHSLYRADCTFPLTFSTVVSSGRLETLASFAELQLPLVLLLLWPPSLGHVARAVAHAGHVVEGGQAAQGQETEHIGRAFDKCIWLRVYQLAICHLLWTVPAATTLCCSRLWRA